MIKDEKEHRQAENLLKALNKASFPEMVGEEHLALAASWMWLRKEVMSYAEAQKEKKEKGPKEVKDKIQKAPKASKKKGSKK